MCAMRTIQSGKEQQIKDRDYVAALATGLAVIEAFGAKDPRLTLSDVARKAGLTRAAARRHLLTLVALGYAESDGKFFWLTARVLRLGHEHLAAAPLTKLAQPILQMIGDKTGEVASLAVLDEAESVFLARSASSRIVSLAIGVGTRLPAYCTSTGRVLLAGRSDAEVEVFLAGIRPMKYTYKTKSGYRQLLEEIGRVRVSGFAISDEEYEIGLRSIAVPVRDASGATVAAISLSVHSNRMAPKQMIKQLLPPLEVGRQMLSAML
jgi:IclR family transcriptional regulator, pca regulon regulatory protein